MTTTTELKCGNLYDYASGEKIRPATFGELKRSLEAAFANCDETGAFSLDGRSVYVADESNEAHRAAGGKGHAE